MVVWLMDGNEVGFDNNVLGFIYMNHSGWSCCGKILKCNKTIRINIIIIKKRINAKTWLMIWVQTRWGYNNTNEHGEDIACVVSDETIPFLFVFIIYQFIAYHDSQLVLHVSCFICL